MECVAARPPMAKRQPLIPAQLAARSPRIVISVVAARTVAKERNPLSLSEGVWPIVPGPSAASRLSRFMSVSTALRAPEDAHLQIAARTAGPTSAADRRRSSHSSILACELLRRHY